jgi:transglutaminase superfamily protein
MRAIIERVLRPVRILANGGRKLVLNPGETVLIARMALWVSILSLLVKLQPLPRALELVAAKSKGSSDEPPQETTQRLARAMDILLRTDLFVFKPICWKRAAVLHRYLALNGISSRIVFGVRKGPQGQIDGHAWLESDGEPILEATAPNYKVTYAFPSHDTFDVDLASLSRGTPLS